MNKKVLMAIAAFFGLYLFATGVSYATFTILMPGSLTYVGGGTEIEIDAPGDETKESKLALLLDNSGPKTEVCPLNNKLYSEVERESWEKRRPLAVMIENHEEARPQSGLSSADVVYEAVAEGGITRFMPIFYCEAQHIDVELGPVRSARTFFLDWVSEYGNNPLYAHVGGANCNRETGSGCANGAKADALGQINKYGWGGYMGNDLNQFSIGYPTFKRDEGRLGKKVAIEHTMVTTTEKLWKVGAERGWTNVDEDGVAWDEDFVPWKFMDQETADTAANGEVTEIEYNFWGNSPAGDFSVKWLYDTEARNYKRYIGGAPQTDLNNEDVVTAENVVVLFMTESKANDDYPGNVHLIYGTKLGGDGYVFMNGESEAITWEKDSRLDRTTFYNEKGKEIELKPGMVWVSAVPNYSEKSLVF